MAKELIEAGHAVGKYRLSHGRDSHGQVMTMLGFAPTLQGRLFAEQLAQAAHRQSWRYRAVRMALGLGSFASGW